MIRQRLRILLTVGLVLLLGAGLMAGWVWRTAVAEPGRWPGVSLLLSDDPAWQVVVLRADFARRVDQAQQAAGANGSVDYRLSARDSWGLVAGWPAARCWRLLLAMDAAKLDFRERLLLDAGLAQDWCLPVALAQPSDSRRVCRLQGKALAADCARRLVAAGLLVDAPYARVDLDDWPRALRRAEDSWQRVADWPVDRRWRVVQTLGRGSFDPGEDHLFTAAMWQEWGLRAALAMLGDADPQQRERALRLLSTAGDAAHVLSAPAWQAVWQARLRAWLEQDADPARRDMALRLWHVVLDSSAQAALRPLLWRVWQEELAHDGHWHVPGDDPARDRRCYRWMAALNRFRPPREERPIMDAILARHGLQWRTRMFARTPSLFDLPAFADEDRWRDAQRKQVVPQVSLRPEEITALCASLAQ